MRTCRVLQQGCCRDEGYEALDVRDCGLRGRSDAEVFTFSQTCEAVLISGDMGFANIVNFPVGSHQGIVIAHYPNEMTTIEINRQIIAAFKELNESDFKGNLIILDPGRMRVRRR